MIKLYLARFYMKAVIPTFPKLLSYPWAHNLLVKASMLRFLKRGTTMDKRDLIMLWLSLQISLMSWFWLKAEKRVSYLEGQHDFTRVG